MSFYFTTGDMHFTNDDGFAIVGGSYDRSIEQPATREELSVRYPGVSFLGELERARISRSVKIETGATIDLSSSDIQISGTSNIGSQAVINGGTITNSTIKGLVSGGRINYSTVDQSSSIAGGTINHSTIEGGGKVINGRINHSKVRGNATVSGGTLNHSTIDNGASVTGGTLNHCTVDNGASVNSGTKNHEKIGSSNTSTENHVTGFQGIVIGGNSSVFIGDIHSFSSPIQSPAVPSQQRASRPHLPPPMVADDAEFDAEEPEHLLDNLISFALINEAVMTPNGDTYDRLIIERHIREKHNCPVTRDFLQISDLRPNRALQLQIDEWKRQHRICT
jgi:hypothetical protein